MARGATALALLAVCSCSTAVRGPGQWSPEARPVCTRSKVLPTLDLIAGGALAAGGLAVFLGELDSEAGAGEATLFVGIPLVVGAVVLVISSVRGYDAVSRCETAQESFDALEP